MNQREFYLPSSDGHSRLHCMEWLPDGEILGAVQIVHGMMEHTGRYRETAEWLADRGIAVYGHDHLGHGRTAAEKRGSGILWRQGWGAFTGEGRAQADALWKKEIQRKAAVPSGSQHGLIYGEADPDRL